MLKLHQLYGTPETHADDELTLRTLLRRVGDRRGKCFRASVYQRKVMICINDHNNDFGQQIFISKQQPIDFTQKYNKLTVPLVLAVLGIIFIIPGMVDRIVTFAGFHELAGATVDIPDIAIWIFFGASIAYLIFCIARISKFKGFQVSVYQKGAILQFIKKTESFHFDDFMWAEFTEIMKHTKFKESRAYINLTSRTLPIDISEEDVPEAEVFIEQLLIAYTDYIIGKIQSYGINSVSFLFGSGMKLDSGNIIDTSLGTKTMPLYNIKTVEVGRKAYKISGILENGNKADLYWDFKYLYNDELFIHIINSHTPVEEITAEGIATEGIATEGLTTKGTVANQTTSTPAVIEFNADFFTSDKMRDFEQLHNLPQEKEDYLAFSAILAMSNYDSSKVFKIQWLPKFIVKRGLKNMWGITDKQGSLETLQDLATAKLSAPRANETYTSIKQASEVSTVYKQARENLLKLGITQDELDKINNLNAWDYGRAGFIARNAAFCGFVKEDETWVHLKQAANNANRDYNNWREYLCAYVLGRAIAYGSASEDIYQILEYLLKDESKYRLFTNTI